MTIPENRPIQHPASPVGAPSPARIREVVNAHREQASRDWEQVMARVDADAGLQSALDDAGAVIGTALAAGRCLLVAGNGGSAAIASHVAGEFLGKCVHDRHPLPAISLAESVSSITAIANDYGYDELFVRGVRAHGRPGDVLLVMSTSGRSRNVLAALPVAREFGLRTIALTGAAGLPDGHEADVVLRVPSTATPRVQEVHMLWCHAWCEAVDLLWSAG